MKTKQHSKSLSDLNSDGAAEFKAAGGVINKRMTTFKAGNDGAEAPADASGAIESSPMAPNDEQLAKVNQFTRSPKTAEDVVVFNTLACNDLFDRDDERFTPETVQGFTELSGALAPVGKSYMVSHDYTKLPVGRIFDVGTKDVSVENPAGDTATKTSKFMTAEVYMPNTEQYKNFIENLDFGINWAVSVGVMLDAAECSLPWCGAPMYMSRFFGAWCQEGHDKGYYYTQDAEKDSWGYYEPTDPSTSGAVKARVNLVGAKDFYELSQCFLGAQYFAALDGTKAATARGLVKAASAHHIPILGLGAKEADDLFSPALVDVRVRDAVRRFGATPDDDGNITWTDDQKLVWQFDPESGVQCLGKTSEGDDSGAAATESNAEPLGSGDPQHEPDPAQSSADGGVGEDSQDGDDGSVEEPEGAGEDGNLTPDDNNDDGKEASVSKSAIVKALKALDNVPEAVLRSIEDAEGDDLDAALLPLLGKITEQADTIGTMQAKATLGDKYIESKRAEAIDWYVRANQTTANGGQAISTDSFERLLGMAGDNVDLVEELINQQKSLAQAKFPQAVRRSSFPTDPHNRGASVNHGDDDSTIGDDVEGRTADTVTRIHG